MRAVAFAAAAAAAAAPPVVSREVASSCEVGDPVMLLSFAMKLCVVAVAVAVTVTRSSSSSTRAASSQQSVSQAGRPHTTRSPNQAQQMTWRLAVHIMPIASRAWRLLIDSANKASSGCLF